MEVALMSKAYLTTHARKRGHERLGLNGNASQKQAERALNDGLPRTALKGDFRKFADQRILTRQEPDVEMYLYGGDLFIFSKVTLITVYPVPQVFRATAAAQWQRWKARKS
jgi:hypothetical protein